MVVLGPMYAEKTTYLVRLANLASRAVKVLYIGHTDDTRSAKAFSTHNNLFAEDIDKKIRTDMVKASLLSELSDETINKYKTILIDEGQFFADLPEEVIRFVEKLGKTVHVVGLSGDYRRKNFGRVHELLPLADGVTTVTTLCEVCAEAGIESTALFTQRKVDTTGAQKEIGASNYRPVCRQCYVDSEVTVVAPIAIKELTGTDVITARGLNDVGASVVKPTAPVETQRKKKGKGR